VSFQRLLEVFAIRPGSCATDRFGSSRQRPRSRPPRNYARGDWIQHSLGNRLGIPIASRQEECHEATIRTRAHDAEILGIPITPN